jgi:hypothetical protein
VNKSAVSSSSVSLAITYQFLLFWFLAWTGAVWTALTAPPPTPPSPTPSPPPPVLLLLLLLGICGVTTSFAECVSSRRQYLGKAFLNLFVSLPSEGIELLDTAEDQYRGLD